MSLKLQEKSSNCQWKTFAIAISFIVLLVLIIMGFFHVYQQSQEVTSLLTNLKAIKARYLFLNYLLESGIVHSYPYGPYAIKWKNLQTQNLDPDPKFDSIKIFTQKNVKKFDL